MASDTNSPNNLKITITADATQATEALEKVGKASASVKSELDSLSKVAIETNANLKSLAKGAVSKRDPLGMGSVLKKLSDATASVNTLTKTFNESPQKFEKALKGAEETVKRIQGMLDKPISLFELTKKAEGDLTKITGVLTAMAEDRKERAKLIADELALVREHKSLITESNKASILRAQNQKNLAKIEQNNASANVNLLEAQRKIILDNANMIDRGVKGVALLEKSRSKRKGRETYAYSHGYHNDLYATHTLSTLATAGAGRRAYDTLSRLQEKKARVSAWQLNPEEQAMWNFQTRRLLQSNKMINRADAESMMMAASSSIGHYDPRIVGQTVNQVTKYAQMERAMGYNKSEIDDIAKNYYGVAEARQVAQDVQKTLDTFRTVFRITTTTAGKISVADVETILRNMGPGQATISDEGLLRLLAYAEQIKVAGRGSSGSTGAGISTVGTNTKMLQLMAMGKPSSIGAKRALAELGIMDDEVYGAYGHLVLRAKNEYADQDNSKEQAIARKLFEDGNLNFKDVGQVVGDAYIKGFKELAKAGVSSKDLAQRDPVKWVESITGLIEAFTVKAENRGIYYGKKGKDSVQKKESNEEFYKSLTDSEMLGAVTTFWAKTGLSQRVLTALSTFSNRQFLHRSEAMMETARGQMDVEDFYRQQVEMGNLKMGTEMFSKSVDRLVESFEPAAAVIGKLIIYVSDIVDGITEWVKEWQYLSTVTAGWAVMKGLVGILTHLSAIYSVLGERQVGVAKSADRFAKAQEAMAKTMDIVAAGDEARGKEIAKGNSSKKKKQQQLSASQNMVLNIARRVQQNPDEADTLIKNAAKAQPQAQPMPAPVVSVAPAPEPKPANPADSQKDVKQSQKNTWNIVGGFRSFYNGVEGITSKISSLFGMVLSRVSTILTGFGFALMAVDIASVFAKWAVEATDWGKKLRDVWDGFTDYVEKNPVVVHYKYDDAKYRTQAQNEKITQLQSEIKALDKRIDELKESEEPDAFGEVTPNGKRLALEEQRQHKANQLIAVEHEAGKQVNNTRQLTDNTVKKLFETDFTKKLLDAIAKQGNLQAYGEFIAKSASFNSEDDKKVAKEKLDALTKESEEAFGAVSEMLSSPEITQLFAEAEKAFKGIENKELRAVAVENFFNELLESLNKEVEKLDPKIQKSAKQFVESLTGGWIDTIRGRVAANSDQAGYGTLERVVKNFTAEVFTSSANAKQELAAIPDIRDQKKPDRVARELTNIRKRDSQYASRLSDKNDYVSFSETYREMQEQLANEITSGKFKDANKKMMFLKDEVYQTDGKTYSVDDIDWNNEEVKKLILERTYSKRLADFSSAYGRLLKNTSDHLRDAQQNTEQARLALDDFAASYTDSDDIQAFDRETKEFDEAVERYDYLKHPTKGKQNRRNYEAVMAKRREQRFALAEKQAYTQQKYDKDRTEASQLSTMTRRQQTTYNYVKQAGIDQAMHDQTIRQISESANEMIKHANPEERAEIARRAYNLILKSQKDFEEASAAQYSQYLNEMNNYGDTHINQLIEDWQDLGSQMQNIQTQMMEGFVEANEKWLDGDLDSWRDYANQLLRLWRNMVLKQGYSELLGGLTKNITNGMRDGLAGLFARDKPGDAGWMFDMASKFRGWLSSGFGSPQPANSLTQDQLRLVNPNGMYGGPGYNYSGFQLGMGNMYSQNGGGVLMEQNTGWGMRPMGGGGFGTGLQATGTGLGSGFMSNGGGVGGLQSPQNILNSSQPAVGGGGASDGGLGELASKVGETVGGMSELTSIAGTLGETFGANDEITQTLTTTSMGLNAVLLIQKAYETIKSMFTAKEVAQQPQEIIQMTAFTAVVQAATQALTEFIISMKVDKATSAFANGGIMTSSGPLPLNYYANGGIAKKAQVAVFGEGRQPEAYVPLPDGRSIPVTINGGESESVGGNQISIAINVTNNSDGSSTESESNSGQDSTNMKKLANNIKNMVKQEIYNQSRPGGLLYNSR